MFCLCLSRKSVKIDPMSGEVNLCGKCKGKTSIITLKCGHIYCVKCYNKGKYYCVECEKRKSKFRLF